MNFKKTLFLATILISGNLFAIQTLACVGCTNLANDKGYSVEIAGYGYAASYFGCSPPKKRNRARNCLSLSSEKLELFNEGFNGGYYRWKNGRYRYELNPIRNHPHLSYQLKVYNSKDKVILNQTLYYEYER